MIALRKIVCFLENVAIFLPPSMVERNVLGSNSLRFLAATFGLIDFPLAQSSQTGTERNFLG